MKRSLQRGEIATIVAIGTLVIIGVASLFSSAFLGKKQTTSTKAQETTCDNGVRVGGTGCQKQGDPYEFICKSPNPNQQWEKRDCSSGQTCQGAACSGGGGRTGSCTDDYREACTCTGGQSGTKACRKVGGPGTEGKTGVDCPWGAGSSCGSCECSGGGEQNGECSWPDWDCGASKCGSDAGCICRKMGKGFCNPGNCRSEGTGNVCVPNKWGDKSSWGCWGPPTGLCAVQPTAVPKPTSGGSSGGTNCTPGRGGFNGSQYYCCYEAGKGPEGGKKLPYPHYEDEGNKEVDCAEKTGVGSTTEKETLPATCGSKSIYYGQRCRNQCETEPGEANWSCKSGWCCEPIQKPSTASSDNCNQFNGLNNDQACITAGCDYFASYNSAPCNKCVPKGTSIQKACGSEPTKVNETILACNNVDLSKICNPLGSASACPDKQTKCKDFTTRGGAVVCCPQAQASGTVTNTCTETTEKCEGIRDKVFKIATGYTFMYSFSDDCNPERYNSLTALCNSVRRAGTATVSITNRWDLPIFSSYTIGLKNSSGWNQSCALTLPLQYYCDFNGIPQGVYIAWISDVYGRFGCTAYYWKGNSQQVTVGEGQNNFSLAWTNTSCSESVATTSSDVTSTTQSVTTDNDEKVTVMTMPELGEVVF